MERNFEQVLELITETDQTQAALDELSVSVDRLYQVFVGYDFRPDVDYCSHCITAEDVSLLHGKPLTELMPDDLEKYARKAMTTWGDVDYFKHFLPRMLEFYPFCGTGWLNPEIAFGKLAYGGWRQWPQLEQDALESYFLALWKVCVNCLEPTPWTYCADFLCAIAQAVDDLSDYLKYWERSDDPVAVENLAAFIHQNFDGAFGLNLQAKGFWEERTDQWNQVLTWLKHTKTLQDITARR